MLGEERRERKGNRAWIAVVTPISAIIAVVLLGWEASNFTITSYNLTAGKGGNNKTKIVIISVSSFAAIAAALLGFYCYSSSLQKKRQKGAYN